MDSVHKQRETQCTVRACQKIKSSLKLVKYKRLSTRSLYLALMSTMFGCVHVTVAMV